MIETGFGKEFSEPPNVTVSAARTHCDACKEPLDPNVMHKCHGNKHYEPSAISHTRITERCPECGAEGMVCKQEMWGLPQVVTSYAIVCEKCRTYLWPLVEHLGDAIASWNTQARTGKKGCWPTWLAGLPNDEHVRQTPQSVKPSPPDLSAYKGACPAVHVEGEVCDLCKNTGEVK